MPRLIKAFAWVFTRLMRVSGAESLVTASNIFVGVESNLTIKPHLAKLTASELCTVLTAGMATVASNVLALYVLTLQKQFPTIAGHLISASLLSAPAALLMSKILLPESGKPETLGLHVEPYYERDSSLFEAIINGANAGVRMIAGIVALLIAVLGLVALVDLVLSSVGDWLNPLLGTEGRWSLGGLFGYLFYPLTLVLGVPLERRRRSLPDHRRAADRHRSRGLQRPGRGDGEGAAGASAVRRHHDLRPVRIRPRRLDGHLRRQRLRPGAPVHQEHRSRRRAGARGRHAGLPDDRLRGGNVLHGRLDSPGRRPDVHPSSEGLRGIRWRGSIRSSASLLHPDKADLAIRYSLAHARVKPGERTTPHRLQTTEVYYILQGQGRMHIDAEVAGRHRRVRHLHPARMRSNTSRTPATVDLVFLCIVDPAWRPEDEEICRTRQSMGPDRGGRRAAAG